MATCEWAMLCDYAFYDESRKICLIGVFNRITVPAAPATHNRAALALAFLGEPQENLSIRVVMMRPSGSVLATIEQDVVLSQAGGANVVIGLANLPLPDLGLYSFNVYIGGELAKSPTLVVLRRGEDRPA